ncbi:monovalent cation:H+ antiporter-2, CPA2 family [Alphaproteobacteria bacterium]
MHEFSHLPGMLVLLLASIFIVVFMNKLKLSPVLGYLLAGALIGKHGLDLINDYEYMETLGEFGVVFLLFVIGLDLTFERLLKMRWHVFGFGGMQLFLTTYILSSSLQKILGLSTVISTTISAALALSSTAVVIQVLTENRKQSTQVGRLSFSVLLMQDLAVVPLLAIVPMLSANTEHLFSNVGLAVVKALTAIVVITIAGRLFLRPFFSMIASVKKDEIFVTTTLLIVLGTSWITYKLGLSAAMGAFIAGLLIAETEYRNKVEDSIMPFKGLFLALFFLTVGMSIDIKFVIQNASEILTLSVLILVGKFLVICSLCKLFRFSWGASIHSGLLLSQVGEFAFILFNIVAQHKVMEKNLAQLLCMVAAFTMATTPLLAIIGSKIEDWLGSREELDTNQEFKGISDLNNHVIIAGFGRVGRVVAYMLSQEQIDYVAIDSNTALIKKAKLQGFPIFHGDATHFDTLKAVGIKRAVAIVLSMSEKSDVNKATKFLAKEHKHLQIIARVEDYRHAKGVKKLGASATIPTTIETGLQLGGSVLKNLYISEHEVFNIKEKVRKNDYALVEEIDLFKGVINIKHNIV